MVEGFDMSDDPVSREEISSTVWLNVPRTLGKTKEFVDQDFANHNSISLVNTFVF